MKIAVASDHAGFNYKEKVKEYLRAKGHEVQDFGAISDERSDYPDFAHRAAKALVAGQVERGVFVCGSGIGISITANRYKGVRAVNAVTPEMAMLARQHNNANVLALGERLVTWDVARSIVDAFLDTEFEGGRHSERVAKIDEG